MPPVRSGFEINEDDMRVPRNFDPHIPDLQLLAALDRVPVKVDYGLVQPVGAQAATHFVDDELGQFRYLPIILFAMAVSPVRSSLSCLADTSPSLASISRSCGTNLPCRIS